MTRPCRVPAGRRRQSPPPAFTLVEVVITATLATVVLGAGLALFQLADRSRGVTGAAESLKTAMAIEEAVLADVRRLVTVGPAPFRYWPGRPVRLAFYVSSSRGGSAATTAGAADAAAIAVRAVRYSLERPGARLARESDAREHSVGTSPLTSVAFLPFLSPTGPLLRVSMTVGRDPGEPPGAPVVHAFLARVPVQRQDANLTFELISSFIDPADAPGDQLLPVPLSSGPDGP
jgi:hypothetical protein